MQLCHVSPHLPPDQAANALLPAELGRWSRDAGHDVSFVTQAPAQGGQPGVDLPGPVRRVNATRSTSATRRLLRLDTFARTRAITAALNQVAATSELVHLHSNGLIIEVASSWASRRRTPTLLTLYGTEIWHYKRRRPIDFFTRAYMRAGAVTFYSERLMDRARELGLDRPNLSVIYPAVSDAFVPADENTRAEWRQALGITEPHVIVNVKRLHELAGQRYLLDAFARVSAGRNDLRLVICGTGTLRGELEAQAARLGIAHAVTFAGLVPNDRIARYAAVADVFALPSLLEALPTVAVEALAAGTPVVSADHPGGVELNRIFGDDVIVVPKQDVVALAEGLHQAIADPRRVRPATPALVRQHFGSEAIRAAYFRIYGSLTTQKGVG